MTAQTLKATGMDIMRAMERVLAEIRVARGRDVLLGSRHHVPHSRTRQTGAVQGRPRQLLGKAPPQKSQQSQERLDLKGPLLGTVGFLSLSFLITPNFEIVQVLFRNRDIVVQCTKLCRLR